MFCDVCGQTYTDTHTCLGPHFRLEGEPVPPAGFAPGYYFLQAWKIVFWDDAAIRRVARDANSLGYGIAFYAMGYVINYMVLMLLNLNRGVRIAPVAAAAAFVSYAVLGAMLDLTKYSLCHFIAKQFFGGTGKFLAILRPLLLGSVIVWLAPIPVVGLFISSIGMIAILMLVFEEIEAIERMQAFMISAALNIGFLVLLYYVVPARY